MAESNFIYYRGFTMVRSGNEIYYGSMGDRFVTKLTIRESEKYKDAEIPTKVMVQMIPTSPTPEDLAKIRNIVHYRRILQYDFRLICSSALG